jgi:hypothetical protein
MQMPSALRHLDDRVLRRKGRTPDAGAGHREVYPDDPHDGPVGHGGQARRTEGSGHRPAGDVVREVLGVVWTVSRWVFLALAAVVVIGIALTFLPTNGDNTLVRNGLDLAAWAAGPFVDVFTADTARRELLYNYALAALVYLLAASLVSRLPGKRGVS